MARAHSAHAQIRLAAIAQLRANAAQLIPYTGKT